MVRMNELVTEAKVSGLRPDSTNHRSNKRMIEDIEIRRTILDTQAMIVDTRKAKHCDMIMSDGKRTNAWESE